MEVKTESREPVTSFNPLAGWEVASRWNASAFDMVAKAWQQWLALFTTVPVSVAPARTEAPARRVAAPEIQRVRVRSADTGPTRPDVGARVHAAAKAEPKRPAREAKARKRSRG